MKELEQNKKLLVIDADIIVYSIGWGCEKEVDEDQVHRRVDDFFSKLFATHETFNYKAYLTGRGNFTSIRERGRRISHSGITVLSSTLFMSGVL